ncbi:hypothetical protein [Qipengyuania profunda]|uniref:hypothetical protein n=1 Tax=Qipengyuania profunda TaxID=3113984 RepID=UPI002ED2AB1C
MPSRASSISLEDLARSRHHFYDSARATRFNRERKLRTAAAVAIFASLFGFIVQQARAVAQAA